MNSLPKIITTSVVRSAHQGESHGGVYLVSLETGEYDLVVDWNHSDIDWEGRGGDRGLRGIAFDGNNIFIAASNEIIVYDTRFNRCDSLQNRYLRHCHEIFIHNGLLYICSTGYDSILVYSLSENRFTLGYCIRADDNGRLAARTFVPESRIGPEAGNTLHLNNVFSDETGLHISGYRLKCLIFIGSGYTRQYGHLPLGTHNARPYREGIIYNDTASNRVILTDSTGAVFKDFPVHQYDPGDLINTGLPQDHARQGFGRGLCLSDDGGFIVAGSSPSTITVYSTGTGDTIRRINLSMDVRNAIHGLELWPYA